VKFEGKLGLNLALVLLADRLAAAAETREIEDLV
jgi:hypothetical protein